MSGTFVGRVAYASVGFNLPDPAAVIYTQSGDFESVTASAPGEYTLIFTQADPPYFGADLLVVVAPSV